MEDMKPVVEDTVVEVVKGPRGELGTSTTADRVKDAWHEKHFKTVELEPDANHGRVRHVLEAYPNAPSLKRYARDAAASGNQDAKDWLDHKAGSLNEPRSEKNIARAMIEAQASKAAKRKKSQGKAPKPAPDGLPK